MGLNGNQPRLHVIRIHVEMEGDSSFFFFLHDCSNWPLAATDSAVHKSRSANPAAVATDNLLVFARNVEADGAPDPILLVPDPTGIAVRSAILRVPPQWGFLGLARGTRLHSLGLFLGGLTTLVISAVCV